MILNPLWLRNTLYLHHTFSLPKKSHKCYLLNISQGFFCWYVFLISTCILCWILAVSTQYYPSSPELLLCHQLLETKRLHFPDSHASRVLILTPPIRGIPARCRGETEAIIAPQTLAGRWASWAGAARRFCSGFHTSPCESSTSVLQAAHWWWVGV